MDLAIWRGSGGSAPRPPGFIASGLRSRKATGRRSPGYPDRLANLRRSGCFPAEPYPPKGWPDSSADGPGNGDFSRPTEEGFKLSSGTQNGVWTVTPEDQVFWFSVIGVAGLIVALGCGVLIRSIFRYRRAVTESQEANELSGFENQQPDKKPEELLADISSSAGENPSAQWSENE